jgi:hypothetical protein
MIDSFKYALFFTVGRAFVSRGLRGLQRLPAGYQQANNCGLQNSAGKIFLSSIPRFGRYHTWERRRLRVLTRLHFSPAFNCGGASDMLSGLRSAMRFVSMPVCIASPRNLVRNACYSFFYDAMP